MVRFARFALLALVLLLGNAGTARGSVHIGADAAEAYADFVTPVPEAEAQFGGHCFLNIGEPSDHLTDAACLPNRGGPRSVVFWGDSSLAMYGRDLRAAFGRAGYATGQLTSSQCPPIIGYVSNDRPLCKKYNDRFVASLLRIRPALVVMSWRPGYVFTSEALGATLVFLKRHGMQVVVLGTNPWFDRDVRLTLADRARANDPRIVIDGRENHRFQAIAEEEQSTRRTIDAFARDVRYVSVFASVCPRGVCALAENGVPLYAGDFHVTPLGSIDHVKRFVAQLLR